jgi:hypothetical protein
LARVIVASEVANDVVQVDQELRNALGAERQEYLKVEPTQLPQNHFADKVLRRPRYILARVQPADLVTTEQNACLLPPLAMSLLGISDGDDVVLEGIPLADTNDVRTRLLRAHTAPESLITRREAISGGSFITRFPSASDALGVYPDLAWIFLDAANREDVGLGSSKLAVVRVRASRQFQVLRELRELLLLLVLALIGVSVVLKSGFVAALVVIIIFALLVVVVSRLRQRLGGT